MGGKDSKAAVLSRYSRSFTIYVLPEIKDAENQVPPSFYGI
jgi:hypothetical protein